MRFFFLAVQTAMLVILLSSCQKEPRFIDVPQTGGGTGGGGIGGGTTVNAGSYLPLNGGTFWKFKDTATGAFTSMTVTTAKKTINNVVYTGVVGSNAMQTDSVWFAKDGANYYERAKGASPNTGAPYDFLFHYLNDTASVGFNWTYTPAMGMDSPPG